MDYLTNILFLLSDVNNYKIDWTDNSLFRRCGSISLTKRVKVTFLNRGYSPHPGLPRTPDDTDSTVTFTSGNLSDITAMRITIRQMLDGSVPSVADIHIWGRPAKSCPQAQRNDVLRLSKQLKQLECAHEPSSDMFYSSNLLGETVNGMERRAKVFELPMGLPEEAGDDKLEESGRVPDDMLDPLTLEAMRFPILLPSGHNIDRSTLDKHVKSQSEYGHAASDPFTGIPFSESHKPIPNVKLKARIDEFNLSKLPSYVHHDKQPLQYHGPRSSNKKSLEIMTPALQNDSKHYHSKVTNKRTHATGHAGRLAATLNEGLVELGQSMKKRRSVACVNEVLPSTLICCKCSTFLFSDTVRYIIPCKRVICGSCIKDVRDGIQCPCLLTHELKSIRRTYHE